MAVNTIGEFEYRALGALGVAGVYAYEALIPNAQARRFFAGEFWIDTGYDDPADFPWGVEGAEAYNARVYVTKIRASRAFPNGTAGVFSIDATPVFSANPVVGAGGAAQSRRIQIHCQAYVHGVPYMGDTDWYAIEQVQWGLYRQ